MNQTTTGLALATAAWFALSAAAAPAPAPPSEGPISDALAMRGILPKTAPPIVSPVEMAGDGVLQLESVAMVPETFQYEEAVALPNGKTQKVVRTAMRFVAVTRAVQFKTASLKFFTVTKDGKLESLETAKATAMLKTRTPVLTGDSAEVDPRNLEMVKPGTLYLVFPPPPPPPIPQAVPAPGADR